MLNRASRLRLPGLLLGLFLVNCATVAAQPSMGSLPPANYRQIISDSDVANILRNDKAIKPALKLDSEPAASGAESRDPRIRPEGPATLSVSSLRKTIATEQGDWFACLKAVRDSFVSYYGISFIGAEIVDWRPAVAIDHCEQQAYGPLPPPSKKAKKDDGDRGRARSRK